MSTSNFKKLLLIISGEFFRDGSQGSRLIGTPRSLESQAIASQSHFKFIEHLKSKFGIETDVQIISYRNHHEKIIIKSYEKYPTRYRFYNEYFADRTTLTNSNKLENIEEIYDGILVIRPDMFLKDFFIENFNPFLEKICYPSVEWIIDNSYFYVVHNRSYKFVPRVNDTMVFIPKKFFQQVYYEIGIKLYHEAIRDFDNNNILLNDFDFFTYTMHDSDPQKDYNPFYSFVCRDETKNWYSYGYEVRPYDFLALETNHKHYFPDWNLLHDGINKYDLEQLKNYNNLWEWWHHYDGYKKYVNIVELNFNHYGENLKLVSPRRHFNETYYSVKDNYILSFYDSNRIVTSILFRKNQEEFCGKSLINNDHFTLKKVNL